MEGLDRWGDSMRALWGSLGICPPIDHIGLPHHMAEELHYISHLKVLGDVQKPHLGMAYLLVQVDDTSEAKTYSMAIVWISSLQARVSLMVEALEMLSSLTSEGSNWPYVLIQLYEGANDMPYPKRQTYLHPAPGGGRKPKWVDKPTKNLLASIHWAIRCPPHRVEWGQPVGDHQFAQIIAHWLQCHH